MTEYVFSRIQNGFDDSGFFNRILLGLFQNHVRNRYPGSEHWSPGRITAKADGIGVEVDIPGASRAYHDVTIKPVNGRWLTIPLYPFVKGVSARDVPGLFRPNAPGGGKMNVLAMQSRGGALVFMYALAEQAFQKQDPTLLPSDDRIFDELYEGYCRKLADETGGSLV